MFIWLTIFAASKKFIDCKGYPRIFRSFYVVVRVHIFKVTVIVHNYPLFSPKLLCNFFSFPFESVAYKTFILNLRGNFSSMILWIERGETWKYALFIVSCDKIIVNEIKINKECTTHPLRGIVSGVILLTLGVGKSSRKFFSKTSEVTISH